MDVPRAGCQTYNKDDNIVMVVVAAQLEVARNAAANCRGRNKPIEAPRQRLVAAVPAPILLEDGPPLFLHDAVARPDKKRSFWACTRAWRINEHVLCNGPTLGETSGTLAPDAGCQTVPDGSVVAAAVALGKSWDVTGRRES